MNLVYDKSIIENFLTDLFLDLDDLDVFYTSVYYRNKYCKNETIRNASSIHLERFLLRYPKEGSVFNAQKIVRHLKDVSEFTDRDNNLLNPKGIVAYINVNPSNPLEAALKGVASYQQTIKEYIDTIKKGKPIDQIARKIKKFDVDYMKAIQINRSKKNFIDIDIDAEEIIKEEILKQLTALVDLSDSLRINTHGGAHILLPLKNLGDPNTNLHQILMDLEKKWGLESENKVECIINKINQVPIPGTIQGGHEVTYWRVRG